jgi:hypothetical protein
MLNLTYAGNVSTSLRQSDFLHEFLKTIVGLESFEVGFNIDVLEQRIPGSVCSRQQFKSTFRSVQP